MTNKRVTANGFRPDTTGFQVPARHLIIGGTLFGVGCAICMAGIAVSARLRSVGDRGHAASLSA